jgi:hypothetical protein
MPSTKRQKKRQRRPGAGRPDTQIRSTHVRVEAYVPPAVRDAVARLADRRQVATGEFVSRSDIVRAALTEYLREHIPEAGI